METLYVTFRGLSAPVQFVGLENARELLAGYFRKWPHVFHFDEGLEPFARVVCSNGRFLLKTAWADEPIVHDTAVNAICDVVAAAARQLARENPQQMVLHAAGVRIGKTLVVFPALRRAGKSVLTASLAARGHSVFSDDVLPVTVMADRSLHGMALGSPLRLRNPLPDNVSEALRRLVAANRGPSNSQYTYLIPDELADYGATSAIGAVVILDRKEGISPLLETVSRGEVLKILLRQNFSRDADGQHILSVLFGLAEGAKPFRLTYDSPEQAVDLLEDQFLGADCLPAFQKDWGKAVVADGFQAGTAGVFVQNPATRLHGLDGDVFAVNTGLTEILHLDDGALQIWSLFSEPTSRDDALAILKAAFPDAEPDSVETGLDTALNAFRQSGLLLGQ